MTPAEQAAALDNAMELMAHPCRRQEPRVEQLFAHRTYPPADADLKIKLGQAYKLANDILRLIGKARVLPPAMRPGARAIDSTGTVVDIRVVLEGEGE